MTNDECRMTDDAPNLNAGDRGASSHSSFVIRHSSFAAAPETRRRTRAGAVVVLAIGMAFTGSVFAAAPNLVSATYLGSISSDDLIEGVAIAADGTLYVAGIMGWPVTELPNGVKPVTLGQPMEEARYSCGFVARFNKDGTQLLSYLQFASGLARLTTVEVNDNGVYVGGYGTEGMDPLMATWGGAIQKSSDAKYTIPGVGPRKDPVDPNFESEREHRGVPIVLRLNADLSKVECGTFLEGWQSIWHIPRPLGEDAWQPTGLGLLSNGDVVAVHDGGYWNPPKPGEKTTPYDFYHQGDYVSRLSPDLSKRLWVKAIYTPPIDKAKVPRSKPRGAGILPANSRLAGGTPAPHRSDWPYDTLGNTRSLRLRVAPGDAFYVAGWSPTFTSGEPWWSPFLWKFSPDGEVAWKAYTFDPMSGGGDRLGGLVSDTAVRSVAVDDDGNVLAALIADGGNSCMRADPRDYTQPTRLIQGGASGFRGRMLFWGTVVRLNKETRELLGGNTLIGNKRWVQAAWAQDVAALPGGRVLAIGRHTEGFKTSEDAWYRDEFLGGFLRVYAKDFTEEFSTSVPDADLITVARRGSRCAIVGVARSPRTPVKNPVISKPAGRDGYLMVVDFPE